MGTVVLSCDRVGEECRGGSSLVTNFLLFGLIANVAMRQYVFRT